MRNPQHNGLQMIMPYSVDGPTFMSFHFQSMIQEMFIV